MAPAAPARFDARMRTASLVLAVLASTATAAAAAQADAPPPRAPAAQVLFDDLRGDLLQPQVAVRKDGALAVVFAHLPKLLVAVRPPGGDWQGPHTVVESPDFAVGMHRGPRVAWAGDALLVSCIESRFDAKNKKMHGSCDLTVRRSTDLGATFAAPVTVNGERGSAAEGMHALAADGESVAVVWLDARGEPRCSKLWCAQSHDGGRTFGADSVAHSSPPGGICPCCHPSLAVDGSGRAFAMWRDVVDGDRDLWFGELGDGKPIAAPQRAGAGHWHFEACPMDGGGLAFSGDGRAVTAWRRESAVYWTLGDGREQALGDGLNPALAARGNVAFVAFQRRVWIAGARLRLDHPDEPPQVEELGPGAYPAVAALPDGRFVVVAERPEKIGTRVVLWER
jgi:hypothetical protein